MTSRRTTNTKPVMVTRYCKFCKDAGKDEAVYTSHFLRENRDPNSRIVCPALLATECKYCFKTGHTTSRCGKYINRETSVTLVPIKKQQFNKKEVHSNMFQMLDTDDEDDVDSSSSVEFPSLTSSYCGDCDTVSTQSTTTSWLEKGKLSYSQVLSTPLPKIEVVKPNEILGNMILGKIRGVMKNWADYSDSDDE